MKNLELARLESIIGGGDGTDFGDGFCTAVGVFSLFGPVGWVLGGGCAIYGIYRLF